MELKGKHVTVFGLNRSGVAVAKLIRRYGATVTVTDTRSAETLSAEIASLKSDETCPLYRTFFDGHPAECITDADLIVVSPGVPLNIPILREARARGPSDSWRIRGRRKRMSSTNCCYYWHKR